MLDEGDTNGWGKDKGFLGRRWSYMIKRVFGNGQMTKVVGFHG